MSSSLPPSLVRPVRSLSRHHRWKVLALGVAANVCFSAAINGLPTTAVLVRAAYGLDTAALGLVLGLMGLGVAIGELPWGVATDRWGDRPVLLAGLWTTGAALAAMALWVSPQAGHVPAMGLLAAGLLLVGVLGGSVNGSSGRAVMLWFGPGERGLAMSIRQTAIPLGGGLGALVLPALAARHGFAAVYGVLALSCALCALLAWRWLHEPPVAAPAPGTAAQATEPAGPPALRDAALWRLVLATGLLCAPQCAVLSFGTVFLHDGLGIAVGTAAAAIAVLQGGAIMLRVWSGHWTDRRGNRHAYLRACTLLSALLFIALAASPCLGAGGALVLLVAAGTCVSAWHGVAFAELATRAGAARVGTALGMANTAVFVGCFLTPVAIGQVLPAAGWTAVWLGGAVIAVAAFILFGARRSAGV
ncbi:MFS transporter [Xylophilus sp.]|uniref:MFS transporter n=1 Tax=Xylophilus sp. TaxID=2653893 RepID=UPI002D7E7764|nr:MFS transporter [Xylophilus sp.]